MIRLIMLMVSVVCLAAFVWFGVTVDIGEHTLFGHLRAIGGSKESQELWRGTKAKVNDALGIEKAKEALKAGMKGEAKSDGKSQEHPPGEKPPGGDDKAGAEKPLQKAGPPQDDIAVEDREAMRRLIGSAHAQAPAPAPARAK